MPEQNMRGATAVRKAIADYLKATLPAAIMQARDDWGLAEHQLPIPTRYDAYEPQETNEYPLIGVNVVNANSFARVGQDDFGYAEYRPTYTVRVFTWVKTPMDENERPVENSYDESIRLRDDLAALVRVALLRSPSLGKPDLIQWDEGTLTEDYSEAAAISGPKFVAAVQHGFTLRYDESSVFDSNLRANTVTLDGIDLQTLDG